jgi:CRISPR-associated protein Cas5h
MEMLSFDIKGKQAHFRKYYANNTALSFTIPPRTTIMGMIAAILGLPKDSYYDLLKPEQVKIGLKILSPVKKKFHRLNLLKIEGDSDFRGKNGRVQIPFEVVIPMSIAKGEIAYRIYVLAEKENTVFNDLALQLQKHAIAYSLSLGAAFCIAYVDNIRLYGPITAINSHEWVNIGTAVRSEAVQAIQHEGLKLGIEEELLPGAFVGDYNREVSVMYRVIFSNNGLGVKMKTSMPIYILDWNGERDYVTLFDDEPYA